MAESYLHAHRRQYTIRTEVPTEKRRIMKKRAAVLLAVLAMSTALAACGSEREPAETEVSQNEASVENIDPSLYVKLGDLDKITVDVPQAELSEEDVAYYMEKELDYYTETYGLGGYEETTAKKVKDGDVVNIDYQGKKDGVAFDGGTAQGYHLEIGSGTFIPGFEEGLVGAKVGEAVDLELTFPEEYGNEELAGQDVIFTVSVNSVEKKIEPEYDEAFFAQVGIDGVKNMEDFEKYYRGIMEDYLAEANQKAIDDAIWEKVGEEAVVDAIPDVLLDLYVNTINDYFDNMADQYGSDLETMVTDNFGMDMETFHAENLTQAQEESRQELLYMAVAKELGIEVTDDVVQEVAGSMYEDYGYNSPEELINAMGNEDFISYARRVTVAKALADKAKVNVSETITFDEMLSRENEGNGQ